ncbi:MAG: hypothetical protein ACPHOL_08015, partial [Candidatus Puniceispirillum sp.]
TTFTPSPHFFKLKLSGCKPALDNIFVIIFFKPVFRRDIMKPESDNLVMFWHLWHFYILAMTGLSP